ncbi:MAG: DNA topoisomerase III [Oscillospiraceae bacterium]|jgi:DNA topoisomerase-3|nr:DNA topoisomerase III [Oscillospiraceae bacterium]
MGKTLVLAEKPSVAKEYAKALGCRRNEQGFISGEKYIVTWALGHLVTLADPEIYDKKYEKWELEALPMLPKSMKLVVIKESSHQFKVVQGLLNRNDVTDIIIATDAGREGELVARWILIKSGCRKPCKRLWVSSQTEKAVKEGFARLRPSAEYDNLYRSAQSRAEADWLVGLNVTRALTCRHNAQLSAGRVQTPTLAMIVEREEEIRGFVPKDYFTIKARFSGFSAIWQGTKGQSRISTREAAEDILKRLPNQGIISEITKQYKHKAPPAAYDLTELQRDANRRFAYSAKQTLSLMQSLYEHHKLLTYPRTDSRYITDDIVPTLPDRLRSIAIGKYKEAAQKLLREKPITRYIVDNKKVGDHHAIIPTEEPVNLSKLSREELNIYDLVLRRFMAVLSPAYEYEEITLTVTLGKEKFKAVGKSVKSLGWQALYSGISALDEEESDVREQEFPALSQGMRLNADKITIESGKTKPPARYTEATLLTAMEHPTGENMSGELKNILKETSGLGTPATRADIIEKLLSSFYVERQGKSLVPTSKGIQLIGIVPQDLRSAELTAKWEQELAFISKGGERSDVFVQKMRDFAAHLVSRVIADDKKYTHDNVTREKCPDCENFLLEVKGKKGVMLICPDRECGYRKSKSILTNSRCPNCHKKLEMRGEGEKKMFFCVCGYREKLSEFEKRKSEEGGGAGKRDVQKYLSSQSTAKPMNNALADQLAKWKEAQK